METSLSHRSQDTSPTRYRSSTELLIAFTPCLCSRLPIVSVCEASKTLLNDIATDPLRAQNSTTFQAGPSRCSKPLGPRRKTKGRRDLGKRPPRCRHSRKENNVSENKYYCSIDPEYWLIPHSTAAQMIDTTCTIKVPRAHTTNEFRSQVHRPYRSVDRGPKSPVRLMRWQLRESPLQSSVATACRA